MKQFVLALNVFIFPLFLSCQSNSNGLIKEAEEKLKNNKASVSQILTDRKYDTGHPETEFRELIKKYCKAEIISIATDTIPGKK